MRVEKLARGVTLYRGDCREIVPRLRKIDAVITDPPYGIGFRSNYRKVRHRDIKNDVSLDHLLWACGLPVSHSAYVFARWDVAFQCPQPKSLVTWVKNNWSMGDLQGEHARQTEVCMFYRGPDHFFPMGRPADVVYAPRTRNENHPTEKPVALMEKVLQWTAGTVVDPFMGSGTTGVAAVRLGRPFVGIELDPRHYATAKRRILQAIRERRVNARKAA